MIKHKPLISIIIPVYNGEKYIKRVISSICQQNYENWEVIIIDDGSTDQTYKILNNWLNNDFRFKYYYQNNLGVSSARNLGIKKSLGEYIVFVDVDDEIIEDYLIDFILNIESESVLLIQDINRIMALEKIKNYLKFGSEKIELNKIIYNSKLLSGYPFNKFYEANIIKSNKIVFDESLKIREDELFFFEYLKHIKYIKTLNKSNYNYITTGENSSEKRYDFNQNLKVIINFNNLIDSGIVIKDRNNKDLCINYTSCFNLFMYSLKELSLENRIKILKNSFKHIYIEFIKQDSLRFRIIMFFYKLKMYKVFDYLWFINY